MTTGTDRTFGSVVRDARIARRLSLGQLAGEVGRPAASVRRWERDESMPSDEIRERLAEVLGLDPALLHRLAEGAEASEPVTAPVAASGASVASDAPDRAGPPDPFLDGPTEAMAVPPLPVVAPAPVAAEVRDQTDEPAVTPTGPLDRLAHYRAILFDPDEPWLGYLRGALTVVAFIVMAWILLWALGELGTAIGDFFDTFKKNPDDVSALVVGLVS